MKENGASQCRATLEGMPAEISGSHNRMRSWVLCAVLTEAALIVAAPAIAGMNISIHPAEEAPVELLRPAAGEVLVSGRESTVAWRALRDLEAEGIHEWEAFLSLDGGRSWPVRITPHLDIDQSSFNFSVPLVPSDDVCLMLRFGDERNEVGYVLPLVLRASAPTVASMPVPWPSPAVGRGETARPGVPGVVLWIENDHDGRRVATRATSWKRPAVTWPDAPGLLPCAALTASERRTVDRAADTEDQHRPSVAVQAAASLRQALRGISLLLLLCRWDE